MKISDLPIVMIRCLTLTIIFELGIAIVLGIKSRKDILNVILVNILTNPIAVALSVYINMYYGLKARNVAVVMLEILIFIVEGLIYKKVLEFKRINPVILSLILNALSYLLGEVIPIGAN